MRIVVFGPGEVGTRCAEALSASGQAVSLVYANEERTATSVEAIAQADDAGVHRAILRADAVMMILDDEANCDWVLPWIRDVYAVVWLASPSFRALPIAAEQILPAPVIEGTPGLRHGVSSDNAALIRRISCRAASMLTATEEQAEIARRSCPGDVHTVPDHNGDLVKAVVGACNASARITGILSALRGRAAHIASWQATSAQICDSDGWRGMDLFVNR